MIAERTGLHVHLMPADKRLPGFVTVDARPLPGIDHVATVEHLPFDDNTCSLVYLAHGLEHCRRAEIKPTLDEIYRVLHPGGIARFSVPDFAALVTLYNQGRALEAYILGPLFGGQDYGENCHYTTFDRGLLTLLLQQSGFSQVREWQPANVLPVGYFDYASYTLAGVAVSLNLEAVKP